jgi:hypothetical protein
MIKENVVSHIYQFEKGLASKFWKLSRCIIAEIGLDPISNMWK